MSFNHQLHSLIPLDELGHGTHTTSTVVGRFVKGASVLDSAYGTVSSIAPNAHLAIYNVYKHFDEVDIIATMESAIDDGVDLLSISMSWDKELPLYFDPILVASFKVVKKKVFLLACQQGILA